MTEYRKKEGRRAEEGWRERERETDRERERVCVACVRLLFPPPLLFFESMARRLWTIRVSKSTSEALQKGVVDVDREPEPVGCISVPAIYLRSARGGRKNSSAEEAT